MGAIRESRWTDDEICYLQDKWGVRSVEGIAKTLKRKPKSVARKAIKLGLGSGHDADGKVSCWRLIKIIKPNSDYSSTMAHLKAHGFPIVNKNYRKRVIKMVNIDDFWRWAEKNKKSINWSRVEENVLGKEPAWVAERRKVDFYQYSLDKKRSWTVTEENYLRTLIDAGKSLSYIAEKLNRTASAIRRRCWDLYLNCPSTNEKHRRWTDDEVNTVDLMIMKGYNLATIAKTLNRSEACLYGKLNDRKRQNGNLQVL